ELSISEVTVRAHLGHVLTKLGLRDRAAAIVYDSTPAWSPWWLTCAGAAVPPGQTIGRRDRPGALPAPAVIVRAAEEGALPRTHLVPGPVSPPAISARRRAASPVPSHATLALRP